MNRVQDLIYNVTGQELIFDCPEGRPSSVTSVAVYPMSTGDDGTAEVATTGSGAVDAVNTTFDAQSAENQRTCHLAATTDIVRGRTYLATNAALGEPEWVTVSGISSAAHIISMEPLRNTFESADTFVGCRISIGLDATWVADSSNLSDDTNPTPGYRVRWVYVVDSVTYVHDAYANLVRYPFGHDVVSTDMLQVVPNWIDRLPTYHHEDQGSRLINEAFREVRDDIFLSGHAAEMIRDRPMVNRLVAHKAAEILERVGTSEAALLYAADKYNRLMDGSIRVVTRVAESTDTSGAGVDTVAHAIWGK